jgi:hypothetical protein
MTSLVSQLKVLAQETVQPAPAAAASVAKSATA